MGSFPRNSASMVHRLIHSELRKQDVLRNDTTVAGSPGSEIKLGMYCSLDFYL